MVPHARRALHHRFDNNRRQVIAMLLDYLTRSIQRGFSRRAIVHFLPEPEKMRRIDLERVEQQRANIAMEHLAVAETDRAERIAVIGLGQRDKARAAR